MVSLPSEPEIIANRPALEVFARVVVQLVGGRDGGTFRDTDFQDAVNAYVFMAANPELWGASVGEIISQPIADWYVDDRARRLVLSRAQAGDTAADKALEVLDALFQRDDAPVPAALSDYAVWCRRNRVAKKKPGRPVSRDVRNLAIAISVALLERVDVQPTRNDSLKGDENSICGCALVAEAIRREFNLKIGSDASRAEENAKTAWKQRHEAGREIASDYLPMFREMLMHLKQERDRPPLCGN